VKREDFAPPNRPVANAGLWPMAGAQSIEIVATLPTNNQQP